MVDSQMECQLIVQSEETFTLSSPGDNVMWWYPLPPTPLAPTMQEGLDGGVW